MASLASLFSFKNTTTTGDDLPDIFPLSLSRDDFVKTNVVQIYSKILTDVAERTNGLTDEQVELLWDNCIKSESPDGLITMLAKAMYEKKELFVVYDPAINLIRPADSTEQERIRNSYKERSETAVMDGGRRGVYISFTQFSRTDMVKLYSALEYCVVGALNKNMNLAKAIQLKMNDLRGSTSLVDSEKVREQAVNVAKQLSKGRDILIDANDMIETAKADVEAANSSMKFISEKLSFYLGLPSSYVSGEQTGGLNSTGEIDTRAVERGLKSYYFSIIKPVYQAVFDIKPVYKSQEFRQVTAGLEALKTFELAGDDYLTPRQKLQIIQRLFDIESDGEDQPPAARGETTPPATPEVTPPGSEA